MGRYNVGSVFLSVSLALSMKKTSVSAESHDGPFDDFDARQLQGGEAEACDDVYDAAIASLFSTGACDEDDNGNCPSTCLDLVSDVHTGCQGKTLTGSQDDEPEPYTFEDLFNLGWFFDDVCEDTPLEYLASHDMTEKTCQDWLEIDQASVFSYCDDACTDSCRGLIDNVYASCQSTDIFLITSGLMDRNRTALEIELSVSVFRNEECTDYASNLGFQNQEPGANTCSFALYLAIFSDDCDVPMTVDDGGETNNDGEAAMCPTSCGAYISDFHNSCDGKTYYDDDTGDDLPYSPGNLVALGIFLDDECQEEPLSFFVAEDSAVGDDLSCQDLLELSAFSSVFYCNTECTDVCLQLIDRIYSTCTADFIYVDPDDGEETPAELWESGIRFLRHPDCNAYADTLDFVTRSPTMSPTATQSPSAPPTASPTMAATTAAPAGSNDSRNADTSGATFVLSNNSMLLLFLTCLPFLFF